MNVFFKLLIAGALAVTSLSSYANAQEDNVYTITAASITDEFKENELKAEAKYKDAQIIVSGYVIEIGKNGFDQVIIDFEDIPDDKVHIGLEPTEEALPKVATFSKGDKVKFSCKKATKPYAVRLHSCDVVD